MTFIRVASSEHFVLAYEARLGARGAAWTSRMAAACEADYARARSWFGGIEPSGLPFLCHVVPGEDGAWHRDCESTRIFVSAGRRTDPFTLSWGLVAEVIEVLSAAQNAGWDCGSSPGEGLSRALATACHPEQLDGYASAAHWLNSTRRNFVENTDPTDTRWVSMGCAVLFLNYLHHQLGFSWKKIVANGGSTLGETHARLTGSRSTGWGAFSALVERHFPRGIRHTVEGDNVFPL
jgi:hypothetical protein